MDQTKLLDSAIKSRNDRVMESVRLLRQILKLGINKNDIPYLELKSHLDTWIDNGPAWSGSVMFSKYARRADLVLPVSVDKAATCLFKAL